MEYGFSKDVALSYEDTLDKVTDELKKEGFGVLTEIDVKDTLKNKIGVEFKKYTILGACNPPLAHKALQAEENIGLMLPCNVVVYEKDNNSVLSMFAPTLMKNLISNESINPIADEVNEKLHRVFDNV